MIFQHTIEAVLAGTKTQTRRVVDGGKMCKYGVGKTYAVQPGRGKKGVARIRIVSIRSEPLHYITDADARAEGCQPIVYQELSLSERGVFTDLWDSIQPPGRQWADNPMVWVIEFELVK